MDSEALVDFICDWLAENLEYDFVCDALNYDPDEEDICYNHCENITGNCWKRFFKYYMREKNNV